MRTALLITVLLAPLASASPKWIPRYSVAPMAPPQEGLDHSKIVTAPPIYLGDDVSQAKGPVYIHLEGVEASADAEADLYIDNPSRGPANGTIDPAAYVGSIITKNRPQSWPITTVQVRDALSGAHPTKARSILRNMAGFGMLMVVKRGDVKVARFVLTTATQKDWLKHTRESPEDR